MVPRQSGVTGAGLGSGLGGMTNAGGEVVAANRLPSDQPSTSSVADKVERDAKRMILRPFGNPMRIDGQKPK